MPSKRPAPLSDEVFSKAPQATLAAQPVQQQVIPIQQEQQRAYAVKNTFIDVPSSNTPSSNMRSAGGISQMLMTAPAELTQLGGQGFIHRALATSSQPVAQSTLPSIPPSPATSMPGTACSQMPGTAGSGNGPFATTPANQVFPQGTRVVTGQPPMCTPSPTAAPMVYSSQSSEFQRGFAAALKAAGAAGGMSVFSSMNSTMAAPPGPVAPPATYVSTSSMPGAPMPSLAPGGFPSIPSVTGGVLPGYPQPAYQYPAPVQVMPSAEENDDDDDDEDSDPEAVPPHLRNPEDAPKPPPGAVHPSEGSEPHGAGQCKRCCFYPRGRCTNGYNCEFCHYDHEKRKRKNKKKKKKDGGAAAAAAAAQHMPGMMDPRLMPMPGMPGYPGVTYPSHPMPGMSYAAPPYAPPPGQPMHQYLHATPAGTLLPQPMQYGGQALYQSHAELRPLAPPQATSAVVTYMTQPPALPAPMAMPPPGSHPFSQQQPYSPGQPTSPAAPPTFAPNLGLGQIYDPSPPPPMQSPKSRQQAASGPLVTSVYVPPCPPPMGSPKLPVQVQQALVQQNQLQQQMQQQQQHQAYGQPQEDRSQQQFPK